MTRGEAPHKPQPTATAAENEGRSLECDGRYRDGVELNWSDVGEEEEAWQAVTLSTVYKKHREIEDKLQRSMS